ncbi:MAG: hypothetical protein J6W22_09020 [Fibrobacter sp.]|nr:hypothetical protein [Fibrobacter sp.]
MPSKIIKYTPLAGATKTSRTPLEASPSTKECSVAEYVALLVVIENALPCCCAKAFCTKAAANRTKMQCFSKREKFFLTTKTSFFEEPTFFIKYKKICHRPLSVQKERAVYTGPFSRKVYKTLLVFSKITGLQNSVFRMTILEFDYIAQILKFIFAFQPV